LTVLAAVMWGTVLATSRSALADGAFPDSEKLLLPADRAQQVSLGTNFGLVLSDDGGASWTWTCETDQTSGASFYVQAAPPSDRIFAVSPAGLARSDDAGCTWALAAGRAANAVVADAFPDPTEPARVYTVVSVSGDPTVPDQIYRSDDGGVTLGAPIYSAPAGATITSVESARNDPGTIYVAMSTTIIEADYPVFNALLARSNDGGASWTVQDASAGVGPSPFRIIAVDPDDAATVYLRSLDAHGEGLGLTRDGGATYAMPVMIPDGVLTAFARLASGTLVVSALVGSSPVGFRSVDGGLTFVDWPSMPNVRDLAERDGKLYAAADNLYESDWAVAVSSDEGATFQPLMAYDQVRSVRACAAATCSAGCTFEASASLWPSSVCASASGGTDAAVGDPGDAAPDHAGEPAETSAGGCACATAPGRRMDLLLLAAFAAVTGLGWRGRRQQPCSPACRPSPTTSKRLAAPEQARKQG
jgi:hypothetical protein